MQRIEIHGPGIDGLTLVEAKSPAPAAHEVLVRVHAVSLNYRDLMVVRGAYPGAIPERLIPASDGAGEVIAVGSGVTRWKVGDRVAGTFFQRWNDGPFSAEAASSALGGALHGMLAQEVVLSEDGLVRIPALLSYEEAATLPCAAVTAWQALVTRGRLQRGQTVLIQGSGGVSVFALQFARALHCRVIATTSKEDKAHRLKELGCAEVINYQATPDWEQAVLDATGGQGVDHVVEVGGPNTLERSLRCVAHGGQVALIGVLAGFTGAPSPFPLLFKNATLCGIYVGSRADFEAMNAAIATHALHPVIDRVFPLSQARAAYRYMESGAHIGKVVISLAG